MTRRIAVLLLVAWTSLLAGCHRPQRAAPHYSTLEVTSGEWDVWLGTTRDDESSCGRACLRELPEGPVRIGVAERGAPRPVQELGFRLTGPSRVRVLRDNREGLRIGGGVLLGFGVASLGSELGVMIYSFQHSSGTEDGIGLGILTFLWSLVSAALLATGSALASSRDRPTLEIGSRPTFVPWGTPTEGGAVGGLAGTF